MKKSKVKPISYDSQSAQGEDPLLKYLPKEEEEEKKDA